MSRGPEFRKDAGPLYFLRPNDKQKQSRVWQVMRHVMRSGKPEYPEYRSQDAASVLDNTPPSTGELEMIRNASKRETGGWRKREKLVLGKEVERDTRMKDTEIHQMVYA